MPLSPSTEAFLPEDNKFKEKQPFQNILMTCGCGGRPSNSPNGTSYD